MNRIKNIFSACVLLFIAMASCVSNSQENELKELEQEIIELHDEVMPLMDPLYEIRKKLRQKSKLDSTNVGLIDAIITIETAEEEMMDWMRNYDVNFKGADAIQTFKYFSEKKKSIEQVGIQMQTARQKGEELIKQFEH